MRLEHMRIRWVGYSQPGQYSGTISIKGKSGKVELDLSHEQAVRILEVVAESVVDAAKEVAETLTVEAIEAVPEVKLPASLPTPKPQEIVEADRD